MAAAASSVLPHGTPPGKGSASGRLAPLALTPLPLGEIRPAGWLHRQLRVQADGMGGHLDEFWADVGLNSGWLGGSGESWERGPYFIDGLLPLAWQLDDPHLKAKAMRFVDWTLDHPAANGMIGPAANDDWWPRMVMAKVLMQYADAVKEKEDPRVDAVLTRYFHHQLEAMPARPLRDWGMYRWQDEALVAAWPYGRTGDARLLALVALLQTQGFDWVENYRQFKYTGVTTRAVLSSTATGGNAPEGMQTHGVNNGMGLKTAAVRFRFNGDAQERENFRQGLAMLDRFHGLPNGMFSCDEHLAGLEPSHGTELCTVVETMYSLEVALSTFGEAAHGDRLETIAFNALPGTFDDAMWAHQYDQQSNQVQVGLQSRPWTTNGPESNLFGLEPNFGCCAANFHQGWPKFTQSLWMHTTDDGLAATLYAPCEVTTRVRGRKVHLREETEYPFRETVQLTITPEAPHRFPLQLRIPGWCTGAKVDLNGQALRQDLARGSFVTLDRTWAPGDTLLLTLPMKPVVSRWVHNAVSLSRGPLVFSLSPGESWVKLRDRGPTADWQVFPQRAWNYGLHVDEASASTLEVAEAPVPPRPFSGESPAVMLRVRGRRLDGWRAEDGVAAPPPQGLQISSAPEERLTLIPYAAAKLRVTAFPQLAANVANG